MLFLHSFPYEGVLKTYINSYYDDPTNHSYALVFLVHGDKRVDEYPPKKHLLASNDYHLFKTIKDDNGTTVQFMHR